MRLSLFLFACCRTLLSVMFKTDLTLTILLIQQHAAHTVQAQMLTGASKPIGTQLFKNESMPCVCECPMFLSFSRSGSRKPGCKTLIRVCVYCLLIPSCAFAFRPSLAQTQQTCCWPGMSQLLMTTLSAGCEWHRARATTPRQTERRTRVALAQRCGWRLTAQSSQRPSSWRNRPIASGTCCCMDGRR